MNSPYVYQLSDEISLFHVILKGCTLREPVTYEWKDEAEQFIESAEKYVGILPDFDRLKNEIRQKIDIVFLNADALIRYGNWLDNTLIHPAAQLFDLANETLSSPYFDLNEIELRSSISPPLLYPEERTYNPLLSEEEREECLLRFRKTLYKLKNTINSIRRIAFVEIRQVNKSELDALYLKSQAEKQRTIYLPAQEQADSVVPGSSECHGQLPEKKERKRRPGTVREYARIREQVENFMVLEGVSRIDAIKSIAQRESISVDKVERALGLRK